MSRYNSTEKNTTKTTTHEGGTAYLKTIEDEWTNLLFSFILQNNNNSYYESVEVKEARFVDLSHQIISFYGPSFASKAAVFTRNELGLRTISELLAAILNMYPFEGKRKFYADYFRRPDGVGEVFAAVDALGMKRTHALIRGAADYLSTLNEYQIGKYRMSKHKYNMFDLINLTHASSEAINKYKRGTLKAPDTWEVAISTADDESSRNAEWIRLVTEEKLGYLALIRNLRNILKVDGITSEWVNDILIPQLTNEQKILKSLVFPYQIYTAWKAINDECPIEVELALSEAFKICAHSTTPDLPGRNLIVLDVSGSMDSSYSANSDLTIKEVSAVYAIALYLSSNEFDLVKFGTDAKFSHLSKIVNVFELIRKFQENEDMGYGTEMSRVFDLLECRIQEEGVKYGHYDRIFVFSDMQVMDGRRSYDHSVQNKFSKYTKMSGPCHVFSFDLGNYRNQVLSQNRNISYITTVSNKIFEIVQYLDNPKKSLIDVIKDFEY